MSLRFASSFALCLLLVAMVLPVSAQQQETEQEADAEGEEADQGTGGEEEPEPPSVRLVHFGPDNAAGSLASLYPDQALELGRDEGAFTGLLKREATPERHGGVLIVAPSGQSPDQGVAGAIRSQLPKAGWMTLSVAQPSEPVPGIPDRVFEAEPAGGGDGEQDDAGTDGGEQAQEGDGEGSAEAGGDAPDPPDITIEVASGAATPEREDDWQQRATDRLATAVNALRNENVGTIVFVGVGDGADLVLRYASANGATLPPDQFGMVWVNARLRPPFSDGLVAALGEDYRVPVLDLYDRNVHPERAERRSAAARRGGFAAYTQSAIPIPRGGAAREQRRVPARIRGWLSGNLQSEGGQ